MCGIFGHIGTDAQSVVIDGLRKLEYRGYDSAGIAYQENNNLLIQKEKGKVRDAFLTLQADKKIKTVIGHTRWATHGPPSKRNAHPIKSQSGDIALVHNGIIENFTDTKEELVKNGYLFRTDTDTEVIVNKIEEVINKEKENIWIKNIIDALHSLKGTYSIGLIAKNLTNTIVVSRRGSPLIIGFGKNNERSISSDVSAFSKSTQRIIYLEDGDTAIIDSQEYHIFDEMGNQVYRKEEKNNSLRVHIGKEGHPHYMIKEIIEQPQTILDTLNCFLDAMIAEKEKDIIQHLIHARRIIICACGTSWHAARIGKTYIETLARIPVEVVYASEFRYSNPVINYEDVAVFISQSGETADTLAAIDEVVKHGAYTLSICNVEHSSLVRKSHQTLFTRTGIEIGVASTKAFTAQVVVLYLLAHKIAEKLQTTQSIVFTESVKNLLAISPKMQKVLDERAQLLSLVKRVRTAKGFLYLGRGVNFPVALEGALKLKEISYIHAEGYPAGEMKHGPIALIDEHLTTIFIAPHDALRVKMLGSIEEVKARNGKTIVLATEGDNTLRHMASEIIWLPKVSDPLLTPLLTSIPLQLFAYYMAVLLERDVDQPRNLAKSVTVE